MGVPVPRPSQIVKTPGIVGKMDQLTPVTQDGVYGGPVHKKASARHYHWCAGRLKRLEKSGIEG
jgi:hypothetical protein